MEASPVYRIRVRAWLDEKWSGWFNGMSISHETGGDGLASIAVLTGTIEQTTLHGILVKIRDLGMPLISVDQIDLGQEGLRH